MHVAHLRLDPPASAPEPPGSRRRLDHIPRLCGGIRPGEIRPFGGSAQPACRAGPGTRVGSAWPRRPAPSRRSRATCRSGRVVILDGPGLSVWVRPPGCAGPESRPSARLGDAERSRQDLFPCSDPIWDRLGTWEGRRPRRAGRWVVGERGARARRSPRARVPLAVHSARFHGRRSRSGRIYATRLPCP
jgi:hypothetical protein